MLRKMIVSFANAMMSAYADQVCGGGYGGRSVERVNRRNTGRGSGIPVRLLAQKYSEAAEHLDTPTLSYSPSPPSHAKSALDLEQ
jgi:hypothetical protein